MIAEISSSANLAGFLGYNFKKVDAGGASVLLAEGLYENPGAAYTLLEVLSDMQASPHNIARYKGQGRELCIAVLTPASMMRDTYSSKASHLILGLCRRIREPK